MSDDFERDDDFSWVNDDGDDLPDDSATDDDYDWLQDESDDDEPRDAAQRTGVTGELPWLSGGSAADEEVEDLFADMPDDYDWQEDTDSGHEQPQRDQRTGVTGQLSWLGGVENRLEDQLEESGATSEDLFGALEADRAERGTDELLDWMSEDDAAQASADDFSDLEPPDDLPPWLQGMDAGDDYEEADETSFEPVSQPADWLGDDAEDEDEEFEDGDEAFAEYDDPDWLQEAEVEFAGDDSGEDPAWLQQAEVEFADDDGGEEPGWLPEAEVEFAGDADAEDPTWLRNATNELDDGGGDWDMGADTPAADHEDEEPEEIPEWLKTSTSKVVDSSDVFSLDAPRSETPKTGELPDWFSGSDADFGAQEDDDAAPPWLQGAIGDDEDEHPEPAFASASYDDEDDDSAYDRYGYQESEEEALVPDWLQGADAGLEADDADMAAEVADDMPDDLFGDDDFAIDEDEVPDLLAGVTEDDIPADLLAGTTIHTGDLNLEDVPDWFGEDDGEPAVDDIMAHQSFLDLKAEIGDEFDDILTGAEGDDEEFDPFADEAAGEAELDLFADDPALEGVTVDDAFFDALDEDDGDAVDWFAEPQAEPAAGEPDWLDSIDNDAILDDLFADDGGALPESEGLPEFDPTSALDELDSMLGDYEEYTPAQVSSLSDTSSRLEELLAASADASGDDFEFNPDAPEWLRNVMVGREDSVAAIIRQQEDRPLDELDDRLLELHEVGLDLSAERETGPRSELLDTVLPGVTDTLAPAEFAPDIDYGGVTGLQLTDKQRARADALRKLAGEAAGAAAAGAVAGAVDAETVVGLEDRAALTDPERSYRPSRPRQQVRRLSVWRVLVAALLLVGLIMPFALNLAPGDVPPSQFAANSAGFAVFSAVDSVQPDGLALVAVEYGPTAAGELDAGTDAILRHILYRGGIPVIVSGNPIGLLHAQNIMNDMTPGTGLVAGRDYYIIRWRAGDAVGLRSFSDNPALLLNVDVNGRPTDLHVPSLDTFDVIVVIGERAEDIRVWAEQAVPLTEARVVAFTSAAAAPLTQPYVSGQGLGGLLVGYRDIYTYSAMVSNIMGGGIIQIETPATPTEIPPTTTLTPEPLLPAFTEEPTDEVGATDIPPGATVVTVEPSPTQELPTSTPTPIPPTPTPTIEMVQVAVVIATTPINVRAADNTSSTPVAIARPGDVLMVIGQNADSTWTNVRLADGTEGWVAASLLQFEMRPADQLDIAQSTDAPTDEPTPTVEAPTPTPETAGTVTIAIVTATGQINVRGGPDTSFGIVGTSFPGNELLVLGFNDDESWVNIRLPNGTEGWIAVFLVRLEERPAGDTALPVIRYAKPVPRPLAQDDQPDATAEATSEGSSLLPGLVPDEATEEATAEVTPEPTALPTATPTPAVPPANREAIAPPVPDDSRWHSMTLGLVAAIVVIGLGNLFHIVRVVFRNRRRK